MTPKDVSDPNADLVEGGDLIRFESRSLDDIGALGGNTEEDERKSQRRPVSRKSTSVSTRH